jgi:hypothetical protein
MKYFIFVFSLFLIANVHSQNNASKIVLDLRIWHTNPKLNYDINILSPKNKSVIRSNIKEKSEFYSSTTENWFVGNGLYKFIIKISNNDSVYISGDSLNFYITGKEYKVYISIKFWDSKNVEEIYLTNLYINRYYNSPGDVTLNENWIPTPEGMPNYIIHNNSKLSIYGNGINGYFSGNIEKLNLEKWEDYSRGGYCATSVEFIPLLSGDSIEAKEDGFIGNVTPFIFGKYKYCLLYSIDKESTESILFANNREPKKRIFDRYLIEKEFEIKNK